MKYLDINQVDLGAETGEDAATSTAALEARLRALEERLRDVERDGDPVEQAELNKNIGYLMIGLERFAQAWQTVRPAVDVFVKAQRWQDAVEACDILYRAEQAASISALGQGAWLAVTFPIEPELTASMLQHIVNETPDDSDGAAVAAATCAYIIDLRTDGKAHDDLAFFATQLLGSVARRHSDVASQDAFNAWVDRLELNDPTKFLVRLRNVIDVMVQDDWWFDREMLQAMLPVN